MDRREARHQATRDEILGVAWRIAREKGLAGISLRDVARGVGMQAPSLYSYFASKNAMFDAMYAQGAREFVAQEAEVEYTGDPLGDLQAMSRFFVTFCTSDAARYQLLFQRTVPGFEPSPESFAISVESLAAIQRRFASCGLTDPESLDLFTAIGTGLTDQQISNDPGGDRWIRLVDDAVEMFYHHASSTHPSKKNRIRP